MASSFKEQSLTAEQVRTRYRESIGRVADPLRAATIVDAIADDPDGLMPVGKVKEAIATTLPEWPDRITGLDDTLTPEYRYGSADWQPIGSPLVVPGADTDFPRPYDIPLEVFEQLEGTFLFRYRVTHWNNSESVSIEAPITKDTIGPIYPDSPEAMEIAEPVITSATLARDGGVKCVVPDFVEDKKEFVKVAVGWMDKLPEDDSEFPALVAYFDLLPATREITVPAKFITDLGSKLQYVVYFLYDKAGNRSQMSLPRSIQVALGTPPTGLKSCTVPLAADGLLDRADAAFPATLEIEEYTGWDPADGIIIDWGKQIFARTAVQFHLPFPLRIELSWARLRDEYDFTSATQVQPVDVDYEIYRGDYPTSSPRKIIVNTDYKVEGPENPNPEPINPKLLPIKFLSSEGSDTELTPDDFGEDATANIELYDDPAPSAGAILTLFYNGNPVSSPPYEIQPGDTPGKVIPMTIPWADIEKTLVMDNLPMYYTLTRPGIVNPQESIRTTINVELEEVDLPAPQFPGAVINCTYLREESGEWGIYVHIPTSPYLKENEWVSMTWQSFEVDKVTLLPGTDHVERIQVSATQERNGIDWFIPNDKCLVPTYRPPTSSAGYGKAIYSINVRGKDVSSDLVEVIIGMFEEFPPGSGTGHCKLTRPPRT